MVFPAGRKPRDKDASLIGSLPCRRDGIDARGRVEKTETLIKEIGLDRDLEDLEKVRFTT